MALVINVPGNKGKSVKNESNDPKINAMPLKKEHYQKTTSAAAKQLRTSPANVYINRAGRPVTFTIVPISQKNNQEKLLKVSEDLKSIQSLFSWIVIAGYHIPLIIRVISGKELKFVSVRMAETQLLSNHLHHLHADIFKCTSVRSYFITDSEAKLLNEINIEHCDSIYGIDKFYAGKDYIVRLEDVLEFYTFIKVCHNKILSNITPSCIEKCGFIRIDSSAVVPYCLKDGCKYLPLFYFEGEIQRLRLRTITLENWNSAYIKFCCTVQGIKEELYNFDSYTAISLDDIKNHFLPETHFEEYWPAKVINTKQNLVINENSTHIHPSGVWIRAPLEPTPEKTIPHTMTASAPLMPQSLPVVINTCQNGWPPNRLGPQMSQGDSLMNGGSHVVSPLPVYRPNNTSPVISNTVSYSNTVPISQCMTTMHNPVPSSSVMSHSNQTQQFYNQRPSNNSQAQQQRVQQHQQQLQLQQQLQQEQKIKVQPYSGPTSVHGRLTNTEQRNAIRNNAPLVITLATEVIDLSSPPSSPAPTPVKCAPLSTQIERRLRQLPERTWEEDSKNDAAYKGPQMSQGDSLMNGGSHVVSPLPVYRPNNTSPVISNTVSYSNTVPISQCMTTMHNPVPSSSVMSHSNQTQQFYNQRPSNNSQAQQQRVQQHQQQKIKVQPYSGPTSVHGRLTNTEQRNAIRNNAPLVITLATEVIDLSSPPSSPAPTPVNCAPLSTRIEWRLRQLPDRSWEEDSINDAAYKIQRVTIDHKMINCINSKPYMYTDLVVTLEDLIEMQLLSFTVSKCAYVLYKYLNIPLFCGNSEQMYMLQENRLFGSMYLKDTPMVMLQDITYVLPQLKSLLSELDQQYLSAARRFKRHRTS